MKARTIAITSLIFFLAGFFPLFSQQRITVGLDDFNKLNVWGRMDVELIPSQGNEMEIVSPDGDPEEVSIEFGEGELKLNLKPGFGDKATYKIRLPYTRLSSIESAGGAVINSAKPLESKELELDANTGGKIELTVQVQHIHARTAQGSDIILYGSTQTQRITANTGGNYLAYDLECKDSYVKAGSGSQVKVVAHNTIDATSNTKAFVGYIGDPSTRVTKTMLGGTIANYREDPDDTVI